MMHQLRTYTIQPGAMDDWVELFETHIRPVNRRLGMHIMIREGTGTKNLIDLLDMVSTENLRRIMFVTDDRHPHDILEELELVEENCNIEGKIMKIQNDKELKKLKKEIKEVEEYFDA